MRLGVDGPACGRWEMRFGVGLLKAERRETPGDEMLGRRTV